MCTDTLLGLMFGPIAIVLKPSLPLPGDRAFSRSKSYEDYHIYANVPLVSGNADGNFDVVPVL